MRRSAYGWTRWSARLALAVAAALAVVGATRPRPEPKPRLVVLVAIDQLRADYLERFAPLFLRPSWGRVAGFRYLTERGARFPGAEFRHFPLYTGPGHAVLMSGTDPYKTGIVGNDWWSRDKARASSDGEGTVYCVDDPTVRPVGEVSPGDGPMGPRNLRCTTVGDELSLATGGAAKVVSLALKDRAAILMGGRLTDGTVWFDDGTGQWVSSTAYGSRLPDWAQASNERDAAGAWRGERWEPLLTADRMKHHGAITAGHRLLGADAPSGFAALTNQALSSADDYYPAFTATPFANQYVLDTARAAVEAESMGKDDVPDLLCVSLSTNDYIGHMFGPNSAEVLDVTVRTDQQLAEFFEFLDHHVPGGLRETLVVLTADHGVGIVPELAERLGWPTGRLSTDEIMEAVDAALDDRFGEGDWVEALESPHLYLNHDTVASSRYRLDAVADVAAQALLEHEGIYGAYSTHRILRGEMSGTPLAERLARAVYPRVSGDVLVVLEQHWLEGHPSYKYMTSHGSPFSYDTQVPLLFAGYGVMPGRYYGAAGPEDIAPTLCELLGTLRPSGCDGRTLSEMLAAR